MDQLFCECLDPVSGSPRIIRGPFGELLCRLDRVAAAAGKKFSDAEATQQHDHMLCDFVNSHDQSLDWFLTGNHTGTMARLAEGTSLQKRLRFRIV